MSKNNYRVLLVANSKLGHIGKDMNMTKGYARFLYAQKKLIPIVKNSKVVERFVAKALKIIETIKSIESVKVYRETKAYMIKKPVVVHAIIKDIAKKVGSDLQQLVFKLPNITDYGTYKLEIFYQSKLVHNMNVIVTNNEK